MFDLHNLGWNSFQHLCLTITREILGQTVEAFLDSGDGGRDGAFTGNWRTPGHEDLSGRFVIQCKFTSRKNYVLRTSDISDEIQKTRRLVAAGLCDSYVLMTNAGLSGTRVEEITALFREAGVRHVAVFGSTWINQQILENKRLRMLVPRVYGLGDLSQILDERAYVQARAILESMREDLAKVVVTDAYRRAVEAINKHSFVLLIGEPAAGKTTVASLLAMAALDQWNASTLKLDDPGEVAERWNPEEPSQFFWLDDAFGVTQYEDSLVHRWNHIFPQIRAMLRKGAKIVMTSRDYIYNRARKELKESAFPLLKESQVVIDVHDLSADEKRQILYNHLKLGKQSQSFRTEIKPYLEGIASHRRFIPETARRLADPLFTKDLFVDEYYIGQFVEKREQLLQEVLQGLDVDSKAALALIYMRNGRLESPIELQPSETQALERLGSDLGGCVTALEALKGSLVLLSHPSGEAVWQFKHPTIGDAYAASLVQSPEYLGIFIQGSAPDRLVEQVTCGDVGIEKAIVVPKSLFPQMLTKLSELSKSRSYKSAWLSTFGAKRDLQGFLAHRCSKEFLSFYLQHNPGLLDQVSNPGLFLDTVPEVRLAKRLHEFGFLPEEKRKIFIDTVINYTLEGEDADALDDEGIRSLFTDDEFEEFVNRVRTELLPRLGDVRRNWESNYSPGEPPEEYMQQLLEFFDSLKNRFGDDESAIELIDGEILRTNEWIDENTSEEPERSSRELGKVEAPDKPRNTRSIFDDIDADEDVDSSYS
jgi:energy-coupling factor transporter ATP-binding protein EcfA2